jgi:hypothetical protein
MFSKIRKRALFLMTIFMLLGCGTKQLFLVEDINAEIEHDIFQKCLNKAVSQAQSGIKLAPSEKELLNGVATKYFLFWGSLSGPKPVVNQRGLPSEAKTLFSPTSASEDISDRYVFCLLSNGYKWPSTK